MNNYYIWVKICAAVSEKLSSLFVKISCSDPEHVHEALRCLTKNQLIHNTNHPPSAALALHPLLSTSTHTPSPWKLGRGGGVCGVP